MKKIFAAALFVCAFTGSQVFAQQIQNKAFSFFGVQGPWYTVGWKMAVTIENTFGRQKLIDCMCDPYAFLATFNDSVAKSKLEIATWSPDLLQRIR